MLKVYRIQNKNKKNYYLFILKLFTGMTQICTYFSTDLIRTVIKRKILTK